NPAKSPPFFSPPKPSRPARARPSSLMRFIRPPGAHLYLLPPAFLANLPAQIKKFILNMG
ncbi:hypothetical protein, partial [Aeromonas eucrenophila]